MAPSLGEQLLKARLGRVSRRAAKEQVKVKVMMVIEGSMRMAQ